MSETISPGEGIIRTVIISYKDGQVLSADEAAKQEPVQVLAHDPSVPLGEVSYAVGLTLNLGNYQSARIDVGVRLPAPVELLETAYEAAKNLASGWLAEERVAIQALTAQSSGGKVPVEFDL